MEASQRKQGDNVRLLSPKIQGENCLSLMYHMYGGSMGSLIIYLNTSSNETVEWIKSGNHPDQWFEAAVFFNTSVEYQVIFFSMPFQWLNIWKVKMPLLFSCKRCKVKTRILLFVEFAVIIVGIILQAFNGYWQIKTDLC